MLDAETHNKITLQSTSLIRGKTGTEGQWKEVTDHFNPLPSSEGRRYSPQSPSHGSHFNPLPSSEGRLRYPHSKNESFILQSTSLIRGKTDQIFRIGVGLFTSIHFPHPREDSSMLQGVYGFETSIHFPHPREDSGQKRNLLVQRHFNPLPSSEGRPHKGGGKRWREYFNPLPSSEGRHGRNRRILRNMSHFNPLPSSEGRRKRLLFRRSWRGHFNPLPSSEGRQQNFLILFSNPNIFLVHLYNFIFYLSNSQKNQEIPQ